MSTSYHPEIMNLTYKSVTVVLAIVSGAPRLPLLPLWATLGMFGSAGYMYTSALFVSNVCMNLEQYASAD